MPKSIYLLSYIGNYSAEAFARALDDANGEDVDTYVNSGGGDVFAGWTMIGKLNEYKGKRRAKVGGHAMSMAAMMLLYFDEAEALDVSNIMLHRADMYVSTPEDQTFLNKVNGDLRRQMEAKIDGKILKELKGVSIKEMFDSEKRIDVHLTAAEAKKIGLITKVTKLAPQRLSAFYDAALTPAAFSGFFTDEVVAPVQVITPEPEATQVQVNSNPNITMTIDELKAKHPDVYAAAVNSGVEQERDRVQAIMVYADADLEAVKTAIDSGKAITAKQTQEFLVKMTAKNQLGAIASDAGTPAPVTPAPSADDKQAKAEAELLKSVNASRKHLGLAAFTELPDSYKSQVVVK